jgi:addiction module RelE/StbE family toxin
MAKVIWAPSALDDIDSIAEYIAGDSPEMASLFVNRLMEATDRLQEFPLSGRMIPEINNPDCREVIYGPYRIMYRPEGNEVWITGVVHGARDWTQERSLNEEGNE